MWQPGRVGSLGRMDTYICMAEYLCCLPETIMTFLIGYTPIQRKKFKKKTGPKELPSTMWGYSKKKKWLYQICQYPDLKTSQPPELTNEYLLFVSQPIYGNLLKKSKQAKTVDCVYDHLYCVNSLNLPICCLDTKLCLTLCDPTECSTLGFPVLHYLLELAQTCLLNWWCQPTVSSSVTPSLGPQSLPASGSFSVSRLFMSVAKVLEPQLQHQSFQWIFRVDFL